MTYKPNKYSAEFEVFWLAYRNACNGSYGTKKEAYIDWNALQKRDKLPPIDMILNSIDLQIRSDKIVQKTRGSSPYWKHACRWLRSQPWDGETLAEEVLRQKAESDERCRQKAIVNEQRYEEDMKNTATPQQIGEIMKNVPWYKPK